MQANIVVRIWSIHPRYLDTAGLVALWREGLLARKVLAGETKGYRNHPQLIRFRETPAPLDSIDRYLQAVLEEARRRNYNFAAGKILDPAPVPLIPLTQGQLLYEYSHLLGKLAKRSPDLYASRQKETDIAPHPSFQLIPGTISPWEKQP
nr:pyrimidine dimer DNA glycosylase/endonuclease V [Akkermansia glycaniphila]